MPVSTTGSIKPRIILHGGAGNISHENVPPERLALFRSSLIRVLRSTRAELAKPHITALDAACHAIALMEDDELFNCGKGAVFTRAGTIELEASVMVSNGFRKRGVGVATLRHVKNPIKLAKEMLVRGEEADGGGAYGHCQLSGEELEHLAEKWGLELVGEDYFWTRRRWDEHRRGLKNEGGTERINIRGCAEDDMQRRFSQDQFLSDLDCLKVPALSRRGRAIESAMKTKKYGEGWDGKEYLPQGTVGAVVLDRSGTIAVATSTGGLTNKLPGRIGDTPTLGAGFWAEEWEEVEQPPRQEMSYVVPAHTLATFPVLDQFSRGPNIFGFLSDCWPSSRPVRIERHQKDRALKSSGSETVRCVVGMSGTGNGDSFLRMNAVRTAAAMTRFSSSHTNLQKSVTRMAGPNGELQKSAGDRWGTTGEGEGGIIGIELKNQESRVVWNFNCGGMFRAFLDGEDREVFGCFREDDAAHAPRIP